MLPPRNPNALGLHLTDEEWSAVLEFLRGRARLRRAWVFGSRVSGIRRTPDQPLDIDLAIELDWPADDGEQIVLADAQHDRPYCARWGIHVDWHGLGDASDRWHENKSVLVWPHGDAEP